MNYVGIDIHPPRRIAVDERGQELARGRIKGNTSSGFTQFFGALSGSSKVVVEACWNWGRIHDVLSEIEQVEEVVLAHPLKTRLLLRRRSRLTLWTRSLWPRFCGAT
jgi:hypothetical protein